VLPGTQSPSARDPIRWRGHWPAWLLLLPGVAVVGHLGGHLNRERADDHGDRIGQLAKVERCS
jgi:hypothetical protein